MSGYFEGGSIQGVSEAERKRLEAELEAEVARKTEKRERVEALRKGKYNGEDPVRVLATKEGEFRERIKDLHAGEGLTPDKLIEKRNQSYDKISDETLGRLEAEQQTLTDTLTGLPNRRALDEEIPRQIRIERRRKGNSSFLMLDLDEFKEVNDIYGHQAGDLALQKFASILKEAMERASDVAIRYGGEEFLIYLPETDTDGAKQLAERIRKSVEDTPIDINVTDEEGNRVFIKQTVSIGCVGTDQIKEWQEILDSNKKEFDPRAFIGKMIKRADIAMYTAKARGRNQVTVYSPDLKKPKVKEKK